MKAIRLAFGLFAVVLGSLGAAAPERPLPRRPAPDPTSRQPIVVEHAPSGPAPAAAAIDPVVGALATVDSAGAARDLFSRKQDVFLSSSCREGESLADGQYVFGVTDLSGRRLLSTDPASERLVTVVSGVISSYGGSTHATGAATSCGGLSVNLLPFSDAGGEEAAYLVWMTPVEHFDGDLSVIDPVCGDGCFHGFRPGFSRTLAFRVEDKRSCSPTFCVSGTKYADLDGDGVRDGSEPGLPGVEIRAARENGVILSGLSGSDGFYRICGLAPGGAYRIDEVLPPGFEQTGPADHRPSRRVVARDLGYFVEFCDGDLAGLDFGNQALANLIGGTKFEDLNANGVRDSGEPGLAGVTIHLNPVSEGDERVATTDASGAFLFTEVPPGSYLLSETEPAGFTQTAPATGSIPVTLAEGGNSLENLFGNFRGTLTGSISGFKFNDLNGNGTREAEEAGTGGVTISLTPLPSGTVLSVATGSDGAFTFSDVPFGSYVLTEVVPAGFAQTAPAPPGSIAVTLSAAQQTSTGHLFGNQAVETATIRGLKIFDLNSNSVVDGLDRPLEGVVFVLTDSEGAERRATSGADGTFTFSELPPGTYVLSEILPPNFFQTFPGTPTAPGTYTITLAPGETRTDILFLNKC